MLKNTLKEFCTFCNACKMITHSIFTLFKKLACKFQICLPRFCQCAFCLCVSLGTHLPTYVSRAWNEGLRLVCQPCLEPGGHMKNVSVVFSAWWIPVCMISRDVQVTRGSPFWRGSAFIFVGSSLGHINFQSIFMVGQKVKREKLTTSQHCWSIP